MRKRALLLAAAMMGVIGVPSAAAANSPSSPTVSPAGRPVDLVQAADSKTSCIYASLGRELALATSATGVKYSCVEVFATGAATWAQWVDPWVVSPSLGYTSWVATDPGARTVVLTINVVPNDVARSPEWRAQGAAGDFDTDAHLLAQNLVTAGLGYSVIRLGPEMNGPWEVDWIGSTKTQWRQWALYFAQIVRTMRAVPGAHFLFDWNVNAGYEVIPPADYYPGNAYVNIVGVDAYDESPIQLPAVGSPERWSVLTEEPLGLDQLDSFAVAHHKPLSIPEWGTLSTHGDDGDYVTAMGHFIATHDVAYQSWYDAGDNHILTLGADAPKTLAAYVAAFGPRSAIARDQHAFDLRGS